MSSSRTSRLRPPNGPRERAVAGGGHELDIERDSDVPISTQIYWQLAYQIESGRMQPGTRLPPVRELGAALRVNPNTVRAVYRRLADAGYVVGRHGAGTRVVDRPPDPPRVRRPGRASSPRRSAARRRSGSRPDEVAQATFTAATERKRPGPHVRVLFAECTSADATFDAERITEAFPRAGRGHPGAARRAARSGSTATTTTSSRPRRSTPTRRRPTSRAGCRSSRCWSGPATCRWSTRSRRARPGLARWASCAGRSAASRTSPRCSSSRARPASS